MEDAGSLPLAARRPTVPFPPPAAVIPAPSSVIRFAALASARAACVPASSKSCVFFVSSDVHADAVRRRTLEPVLYRAKLWLVIRFYFFCLILVFRRPEHPAPGHRALGSGVSLLISLAEIIVPLSGFHGHDVAIVLFCFVYSHHNGNIVGRGHVNVRTSQSNCHDQ